MIRDPHATPVAVCLAELNTSADGLSTTEAARRLAEHGANRLPEAQARGPVLRFLMQFDNELCQSNEARVRAECRVASGHDQTSPFR